MTVQILRVTSPELFVGTDDDPRQILRVELDRAAADGALTVRVDGAGVSGAADLAPGDGAATVEVPLDLEPALRAAYGTEVDCTVTVLSGAGDHRSLATDSGRIVVAEPGWTMVMVSHFHYDPVWWNTQAAYTTSWDLQGPDGTTRPVYTHNAFSLVDAHLKLALRDPAYCFVLAELDYLKPYFDTFPEQRAVLRRLIAEGRVEIIGGTYNEPNTNLTGAETTIRNIVYGVGYQRHILGGDPQNAWQLDVFGHDPQFPGYLAKAGLTGSAWARGPFHQWGPLRQAWGDPKLGAATVMQFASEFEWISPSGDGVLTHYMPDHYGPGWELQHAPSVEAAGETAYQLFATLKTVAATKNTLLPVGGDYTPPNNWITALHHDWADRYAWPKFVCGTTKHFMDRVRAELDAEGRKPSPQSRDMNPIYTGKDVSYIDTKQAQRAAEVAAVDAEKLGTFADLLGLGRFAEAALDKVWRQLAYGAHHDAITGSESDQVYIDLVTGWREAHDLSADARDAALTAFAARIETHGPSVVVTNTLSFPRTDLVTVAVTSPDVSVVDDTGAEVPSVVEGGTLTFLAHDVPSVGWRTYRLVADSAGTPAWGAGDSSDTVENEFFSVTVDPSRGGGVSGIVDKRSGRQVLKGIGNELRVYQEYPDHPRFGEGPWHLTPSGPVVGSSGQPAKVLTQVSPLGSRVISRGEVDGISYESVVTAYAGLDRIEFTTRVLDHAQSDRLVRVKFPADLPGALPLSEVAGAVVGRGFGLIDVDSEQAPWTLDNPANTWFGLGSTARIDLVSADKADGNSIVGTRPLAVAEIVVPDGSEPAEVRDLVVALARVGVTATTSLASSSRYGHLKVDSNLPDLRILVGGALADDLGPLDAEGPVLVPARTALAEVWQPNADVRDVRAISALVLPDAAAVQIAIEDLADARITATLYGDGVVEEFTDATVALLTYGLPGFAVDVTGALHASLLRSCTGWPSGIWIDPPRRTSPDGSSFQLQHWTHEFRYALTTGDGDWRALQLPSRGQEFSSPLLAATTDAAGGDLPTTHSLLQVLPARDVLLSTAKPAGNPIAQGAGRPADPRDGVTLRLIEATGLGSSVEVSSALPITGATHADLLEQRGAPIDVADGVLRVDLPGSAVDTFVVDLATDAAGNESVLGPDGEVAQPSYSRYWLHNRGPAQVGFLPVSLSVSPTLTRTAGKPFEVSMVIANQYVDSVVEGTLTLDLPDGWTTDQPDRQLRLAPGGHVRHLASVNPPKDCAPGQYFVAARVLTRTGELAGGAGVEAVEDVVTVFVGDSPELTATIGFGLPPTEPIEHGAGAVEGVPGRPTGLTVTPATTDLRLAPGDRTTLDLTFTNDTHSEIRAELQLASPYGTWSWLPEPLRAVVVPPRSSIVVPVPVEAPAGAAPAHAWVLPKVMWFGRAQYAPTVRLEIA